MATDAPDRKTLPFASEVLSSVRPVMVVEPVALELNGVTDIVVDVEASVNAFRAAYSISREKQGSKWPHTRPNHREIEMVRDHFNNIEV